MWPNRQLYQIFQWMDPTTGNVIVSILKKMGGTARCPRTPSTSPCPLAGVKAVTARAPSMGPASAPRRDVNVWSSTGKRKSNAWTVTMSGTPAARTSRRTASGITAALSQRSRWPRFLTTRAALTRSTIQKPSVPQKPNRFSKLRSSREAPARAATTALPAGHLVTRKCRRIRIWTKSETGFQITIIIWDFLGRKQIKWCWIHRPIYSIKLTSLVLILEWDWLLNQNVTQMLTIKCRL